jgi:hypothetical protein
MALIPEKEKPQIRQAGSAEAFVGSAATGRERIYNRYIASKLQPNFLTFIRLITNSLQILEACILTFFPILHKLKDLADIAAPSFRKEHHTVLAPIQRFFQGLFGALNPQPPIHL